jgi:tRNA A-37 threonylcarbamoyl transferase component Bud32
MHDRVISDRYRLIEPLGSGGAAEVWRARDELLGVDRAVKILSETEAERPTAKRRLRAEAAAIASIDHPNVVRVLEIGTIDERDCIVMELVPGGSLADRVVRDGPLPIPEAIERMVEALAGLAAAHAAGIIHRDVKPPNLLLGADGRAVVADFGIALIETGERRTREGVSMGSFAFMAPEQRLDARAVGPEADVYAVGASLFWMVTGRTPVDLFAADPDSPRFGDLDPRLVAAIRAATALEPEDRPQTCAALASRLLAVVPEVAARRPDLDPARFPAPVRAAVPDVPPTETTPIGDVIDARVHDRRRKQGARAIGAALLALAALLLIGVLITRAAVLPDGGEPPPAVATALPDAAAMPESLADPVAEPAPPPAADPQPERPALAVAPAPEVAPPPARAAAPPIAQAWRGALGGRPCTLALSGPDRDLRGELAVSFGEQRVRTQVRGTFDVTSGELRLEDVEDTPDAGSYLVRRAGRRLTGRFTARHRDFSAELSLEPSPP